MKKTHDDGFEMYRYIEERVKANVDKRTAAPAPNVKSYDGIGKSIETIKACSNSITAITRLLTEFQIDSECGNEIPKSVTNGTIKGGLLDGLKILSIVLDESIEGLEDHFNGQT